MRTELRGDDKHFAFAATDDDGAHVLFFNGTTFTLGEAMTTMTSLKATEDGQTVVAEGVYKGEQQRMAMTRTCLVVTTVVILSS